MMFSSVLWVALFIGVLITFHEFGHLIAAKLARIPVEVFSVGFGPVLLKKKLGETEYRLSLIPLGGFIKMVGEEEKAGPGAAQPVPIPEGMSGYADKPLGTRVAVIAAGPVSNLVLGFLMLVVMYLAFGIKYVAPFVEPVENSAAARAGIRTGDLLVAAAGETIPTFEHFDLIAERNAGQEIELALRRGAERYTVKYTVPKESADLRPVLLPVVDKVRRRSPADKLGLAPGDTILSINDKPVRRWEDFVAEVVNQGGVKISITWQRNGQVFSDSITPATERDQVSEKRIGQVGIWVRLPKKSLSVPAALLEAAKRSGYVVVQTFVIIYKVVTRQISSKAIGGPIMVAKIAYEGANWGAEYFLGLWALLSINLFVVNMLPVPVLDGGRILL
ncbi:MAG: RIP metalloprotease RseP, partial [candidate division WOR-3 bacterium]